MHAVINDDGIVPRGQRPCIQFQTDAVMGARKREEKRGMVGWLLGRA